MKHAVYAYAEYSFQASCDYLFRSSAGYGAEKKIILNPKSILIDFEKAVVNAVNDVFPQMSVKICHFHFVPNIWTRIET